MRAANPHTAGAFVRRLFPSLKGANAAGFLAGILLILGLTGCMKDPSLVAVVPEGPGEEALAFVVPQGWPAPVYTFQDNALTKARFELGRKLFYEVLLSKDNTVSCGSCHAQFAAFSHLDHPLSHGINGSFGNRNAPGIFNMAWKPLFFWDGGVNHLENQPLVPIENLVEMGLPMKDALAKLNASADYPALFEAAYGQREINSQMVFRAFAQFMAMMISADSRYDRHERGTAGGTFTAGETRGLQLFRANCASCHKEPLLTDFSFRNNGLKVDASLNDSGRAGITGLPADKNKFMVPSLRNVALTRPYMHDGSINTLEEVIDHYRKGIVPSATLDPILQGGILLTDADKADLVLFLNTLSDETFITDPRFAEPQ